MSLGVRAYKVGGAGQWSSMRMKYPWQPYEWPPTGTVTLNNSVEYLPTQNNSVEYLPTQYYYLAQPSREREGGVGKKTKHELAGKEQASAITLCEELQASNWVYKSQGAPAGGIWPPLL